MTRRTLLALLLLPLVPAASAVDLTIEARDANCPGEEAYCFIVTGDLDDVEGGATVNVTFRNAGRIEHELSAALLENADVGGDTPKSAAFFEIDPIDAGEEETGSFVVPEDAGGIYLWCDVAGHEQLGMYTEAEFEGAGDNGAPLGVWPALVAVGVAVLAGRR